MKLLLTALLTMSCAMNYLKPIKKVHKSKVSKIFAKYRNVLSEHDWEIEQSDGAGGFLKATKPYYMLGVASAILVSNVSCSEYKNATKCIVRMKACKNTVPLSGCMKMTDYYAQKDEVRELLDDLKRVR